MTTTPSQRRDLVLIGGGHTHVQVLRAFATEPPPNLRLTVVLDQPIAIYSGMVPGFVAGQYASQELEIDVLPLARRAGARVILSAATGIDAENRRVELLGRPSIPYDLASVDIGSTVIGTDLPGIAEHAIPTRPISRLVKRVDGLLQEVRKRSPDEPLRVLVVGGGAGGVELAFAMDQRIAELGRQPEVTLLHGGDEILPGYPASLVRRARAAAQRRDIGIRTGARATGAEPGRLVLADGEALPFDSLLWVAGATSHSLFRDSGLPTDERGFLSIRSTLQAEGYDDLFGVGDCATLDDYPQTPKAGVYAVRQGPYLIDNLRAKLAGRPLRRYRPQRDFLTLLNLGDGSALGAKWGLSFEGEWVMRLKDRIDRKFMDKFQVLEPGGALTETFQAMGEMDGEMEMHCGGCAAKVGQSVLSRALERLPPAPEAPEVLLGLERADDAAAVQLAGGEIYTTTVDAFRAFTDDPYLVGRVAAVNAISDLLATGVEPRYALALVALPLDLDRRDAEETLYQLLAGIRSSLDPLGVRLLGGHSTTASELVVGLTVDGFAPSAENLTSLEGLEPGQSLILTKPLGTGVLFQADMRGRARGPWLEAALASMLRSNADAARLARKAGATAITDITGFGLAGHLGTMLRDGRLTAEISLSALPALPGALELIQEGLRSTFHEENAQARKALSFRDGAGDLPAAELLFDPQTSGGLLFAVISEAAPEVVERLRANGDRQAAAIGRAVERSASGAPIVVRP